MGTSAAVGVGEHHFVGIAVERPEPAGFHLASLWPGPALMAGLYGRLVNGQHSAAQHALGLSIHNGPQQSNGPLDQIGQSAATEGNTGLLESLMLAIQR